MLYSTVPAGFIIATAYVYTFEDCIEVCTGLDFGHGDQHCLGVSYEVTSTRPVNCWAHDMSTLSLRADADVANLEAPPRAMEDLES